MSKIKHFDNVRQLADELKNRGVCSKNFLIGIDGFFGAGKTYLAKELGNALNINVINIDKYLIKNKEGSVKNIDLEKLKKDIISMGKKGSLIIEGACLLSIFELIDIKYNLLIYIKRIKRVSSFYSFWRDKDECEYDGDIKEKIKQEKINAKKLLGDPNYEPREPIANKENMEYHQEFKPHKKANYYYNRNVE